jgi:hypothetical protein
MRRRPPRVDNGKSAGLRHSYARDSAGHLFQIDRNLHLRAGASNVCDSEAKARVRYDATIVPAWGSEGGVRVEW